MFSPALVTSSLITQMHTHSLFMPVPCWSRFLLFQCLMTPFIVAYVNELEPARKKSPKDYKRLTKCIKRPGTLVLKLESLELRRLRFGLVLTLDYIWLYTNLVIVYVEPTDHIIYVLVIFTAWVSESAKLLLWIRANCGVSLLYIDYTYVLLLDNKI